ncbi:MAG: hypothetical protein U0525_03325 [Patescibacteria group bacterium]
MRARASVANVAQSLQGAYTDGLRMMPKVQRIKINRQNSHADEAGIDLFAKLNRDFVRRYGLEDDELKIQVKSSYPREIAFIKQCDEMVRGIRKHKGTKPPINQIILINGQRSPYTIASDLAMGFLRQSGYRSLDPGDVHIQSLLGEFLHPQNWSYDTCTYESTCRRSSLRCFPI